MNFIASSCCQASVDLSWRRGMVRCSTLPALLAIFMPLLVWTRLFRWAFSLPKPVKFQKWIVFYKSPMAKFYSHSLAFVLFLALHAYVVLFDFRYQMALSEKLLLCWVGTFALEEISELGHQQPKSFYAKLMTWYDSVWNRFDIVAFIFAAVAFALRMNRSTFTYGRVAYAFNTAVFFCRVLRIYHVHFRLGPKLVIFYRMLSEVLIFMALLIVFILGYGLAAQSLLRPSPSRSLDRASLLSTLHDVVLTPYWQMYGELLLENMEGRDEDVCHFAGANETTFCENPKHYTWAVQVMLIFYLIIGNIMLLNLLIAIFTYVFDEVHENSMEIWKYERFRLIREYDSKPGLVPPVVVIEHVYRFSKAFWKKFLRKHRENLDDYMTATLLTLRIFEKEAVSSFLAKLQLSHDASLGQRVARIADKIDVIAKFVEQEEELRSIEEDLEWAAQQLELDEDLIERHHSDDFTSDSDTRAGSGRRRTLCQVKTGKHEIETNEAGKGLSESDEEDGVQMKPTPIEAVALNSHTRRKVSVNRKISVRKKKHSSISLDSNLHSILKSKRDPVAQITSRALEDDDLGHTDPSGEDEGRTFDRLTHEHDTARAASPRSVTLPSAKTRPPALGGGWDGELHYPSRPTSAALRRQLSARRRRTAGSATQIMNEVDALNCRIEALTENVEKFQRNFERLVDSLSRAGHGVASAGLAQAAARPGSSELQANFVEPRDNPAPVAAAVAQKSSEVKGNK